ncbi:hypothetical protein DdX_13944 [Ditylenchus destructor]|uniref:Uncharacterized protein n=1 Tax=Ditylenchus destructor TaxID=166010 RepID=A0AAD4MSZ6_9BILA|nr:hypothetical protein DdX_13944 [Ditylenchus destructor]
MDTFNTYNAYTCLVMGLSSNLTLAWLILKGTKDEMKHYSTILLHSIVVNIAYLVVSAIVQPTHISQKERPKTTTVDLTLTISCPIYIARRRRRRASPVVGRGAPDPPPWNVRELRTYTPEQPLLPNNPTLTADGGGHTDTDEGILMAVREAMTNPISRCAR